MTGTRRREEGAVRNGPTSGRASRRITAPTKATGGGPSTIHTSQIAKIQPISDPRRCQACLGSVLDGKWQDGAPGEQGVAVPLDRALAVLFCHCKERKIDFGCPIDRSRVTSLFLKVKKWSMS